MRVSSINAATDAIFHHFKEGRGFVTNSRLKMAAPLGLGKPNRLLNDLYRRVRAEKPFELDIYTALSLDIPQPKSELEARFLKPFVERHWGKGYPRLAYLEDLEGQGLPSHINLYEFYVSAGSIKSNAYAQQHYRAINYTHVAQNLADLGVQLIVQLVARRGDAYSLSSNSDLTLDVVDLLGEAGRKAFIVGVVHPDLPFLGGDAVVPESFFDIVVDEDLPQPKLFAVPRESLSEVDTVIGLHASSLIADGGTLQIGIGSLSDSVVKSLLLRQRDNLRYRAVAETFGIDSGGGLAPFEQGLYGTSELVMDGFMHLRKAGILKRTILDKAKPVYMHAAFALGSADFYEWLRDLSGEDFEGFAMTRVSKVNDLYDADETSLRRQRTKARFFNTAMQVTLLGAAASDTLPDGTVISGVGGQYNFVAMAHELREAYSIIMLRSTSIREGKRVSNIVWNHGNLTIPRHLRDVVVTEYGVAYIRGLPDAEVIKAILNITDGEFQEPLLKLAKAMKKVEPSYQIPERARQNTPAELKRRLKSHAGFYEPFPFGSDFDATELRLAKVLGAMKNRKAWGLLSMALKGLGKDTYADELARMGLLREQGLKPLLYRAILRQALADAEKNS